MNSLPQTINAANLILTKEHWIALSPMLIVTVGFLVTMLLATIQVSSVDKKIVLFSSTLATLVAAGTWQAVYWTREPIVLFAGMMQLDYLSSFFSVLLVGSSILILLASYSYLEEAKVHYSEFYPILLSATLGMLLLANSNELLSIFVALELMSLSIYVLVGFRRMNALSNEASVKYFVMGGVAAAIYLYGAALVYGSSGTTKLSLISSYLATEGSVLWTNPLFAIGTALLLTGFFFKIAAAPFHLWSPDVYEGSPTNITAYMATALKAAVFAAFLRVCASFLGDQGVSLSNDMRVLVREVFWWIALATMIGGNFVALMQSNIKRMMAYSAVAHTGYLLIGILSGPTVGYSGVIFYLVAYSAMNIGAFTIMTLIAGKDDSSLTLNGLSGLARKHPLASACLALFFFSLAGFPPTAGFVAKYYLFTQALAAGETLLVLLGLITSAVSIYYYLRVVVLMYMQEPKTSFDYKASKLAYLAVAICVFVTINYGLFPGSLLHAVKKAALF